MLGYTSEHDTIKNITMTQTTYYYKNVWFKNERKKREVTQDFYKMDEMD